MARGEIGWMVALIAAAVLVLSPLFVLLIIYALSRFIARMAVSAL